MLLRQLFSTMLFRFFRHTPAELLRRLPIIFAADMAAEIDICHILSLMPPIRFSPLLFAFSPLFR